MLRASTNLLGRNKAGGFSRGPHRATGVQYRRRANPRARGVSLNVGQHGADGLRGHHQFNLGEWKFEKNRSHALQNVRIEGFGGEDTRVPNREKLWDPTWGELDYIRKPKPGLGHAPPQRDVADRKLVPKIVMPKHRTDCNLQNMKPYFPRNAPQWYKFQQDDPYSAEELYAAMNKRTPAGLKHQTEEQIDDEITRTVEKPNDFVSRMKKVFGSKK